MGERPVSADVKKADNTTEMFSLDAGQAQTLNWNERRQNAGDLISSVNE